MARYESSQTSLPGNPAMSRDRPLWRLKDRPTPVRYVRKGPIGTAQAVDSADQPESGHQPCRSGCCFAVGDPVAPGRHRHVFHEELDAAEQSLGGGCDSGSWPDLLVCATAEWRSGCGGGYRVPLVQTPGSISHTEDRRMECDRHSGRPLLARSLPTAAPAHQLALVRGRVPSR